MPESSTTRFAWIGAAIVVLAAFTLGGFYLGKSQVPEAQVSVPGPSSAAQPQQAQARALPPGVTRLPIEHFTNWSLACVQNAQGHKTCELVLRAVDRTRHALVFSMAVAHNMKGDPVLAIVTPPSALLSGGVELAPATGNAMKFAFTTCGPGACQAVAPLTDSVVSALSSNDALRAAYIAGNGRTISYNLPIKGFADGYAAWKVD